jgi:hypothetical protein
MLAGGTGGLLAHPEHDAVDVEGVQAGQANDEVVFFLFLCADYAVVLGGVFAFSMAVRHQDTVDLFLRKTSRLFLFFILHLPLLSLALSSLLLGQRCNEEFCFELFFADTRILSLEILEGDFRDFAWKIVLS